MVCPVSGDAHKSSWRPREPGDVSATMSIATCRIGNEELSLPGWPDFLASVVLIRKTFHHRKIK